MFEFPLRRKAIHNFIHQANTWDNITARKVDENVRARKPATSAPKSKYAIQFKNMITNITDVKPGCRSCRGTF